MIEKLSTYVQSTGRNYKDYYATLIHWYEQDKGKLKERINQKYIPLKIMIRVCVYKVHIRRLKGFFRALVIKQVSEYA